MSLLGTVRSFRADWGFLVGPGHTGDLFCHAAANPALKDAAVTEGTQVYYDIGDDPRSGKPCAVNVSVAPMPVAAGVGQTFNGKVKSFRGGWGFVISPALEKEVYVNQNRNPMVHEGNMQPGVDVQFEVAEHGNATNKFEAVKVVVVGGAGSPATWSVKGKGKGAWVPPAPVVPTWAPPARAWAPPPRPAAARFTRSRSPRGGRGQCRGVVRSFHNSWGWIVDDATGADVFVHSSQNTHLTDIPVGATVSFDLAPDHKGRQGAVNVTVLGGNATARPSFKPVPYAAPPAFAAPAPRAAVPYSAYALGPFGLQQQAPRPVPKSGTKQMGTLKFLKGDWGFVVHPSMGDVFFHKKDSPTMTEGLPEGQHVSFFVVPDKDGKSKAVEVEVCANPPAALVDQRVSGWVKSFKGGWGFVQSESFEGDLYFTTRSNPDMDPDLEPGDTISFEVKQTPYGKLEAVNVARV
mmetsp:Transcript_9102/g.21796  ORF Transcript_9102/g.21796 Transcript_9102/m.21796 type:complete len:463 (-) Transcript_9102:138-1526(-)